MKLYTEKQLILAMQMARSSTKIFTTPFLWDKDEILDILISIELPSDEEIFQKSIEIMEEWYGSGCKTEIDAHFRGAKWMRDKIQEGNQ